MSARGHHRGAYTRPGHTMTDLGPVNHVEWRGLHLPVAVEVDPQREGCAPVVRFDERGYPMYVLPGGRAVSARELR